MFADMVARQISTYINIYTVHGKKKRKYYK